MRVARVQTRREVRQAWSRASFLVARADEDAFGELMGLSDVGKVRFAGERFGRRGERFAAFEVSRAGRGRRAQTKGSIRIGQEFFTLALRDYRDWKSMWWREAIQNAVDAKAKVVHCEVEWREGGMLVSCDDDGKGMSRDVLLNKFLVLGATTKTAEQAAVTMRGGFGKAKELLVLPWIEWRITSGTTSVAGAGVQYRVEQVPKRKGTKIEVLMPHNNTTEAILAYNFIKKCNLPRVDFSVNHGRLDESDWVKADLKPGRKIREFKDNRGRVLATLHHYKKEAAVPQRLLVRAQGLMMFGKWVSSDVPGQLILELKAPSVELLTANRDGLSDRTVLRWSLEDYVNTLAADITSALKKKSGLVRKKYYGRGGRTAATDRSKYTAAVLQDAVGDLEPEGSKGAISKKQLDALGRGLVKASGDQVVKSTTVYGRPSTPGLAGIMLGGVPIGGSTDFQAALQQLAWEPDFFLVNEREGFRVPKRFTPEGMSGPVLKLARLWTELCRFVLIQLGCRETFGVGFTFTDDGLAEYIYEDGENWLMLNPMQTAARTSAYSRGRRTDESPPGRHAGLRIWREKGSYLQHQEPRRPASALRSGHSRMHPHGQRCCHAQRSFRLRLDSQHAADDGQVGEGSSDRQGRWSRGHSASSGGQALQRGGCPECHPEHPRPLRELQRPMGASKAVPGVGLGPPKSCWALSSPCFAAWPRQEQGRHWMDLR